MTWWRDRESAVRIYEGLTGVLRSLGIRFADRLSTADLRIADEYIDANELGLALEHLADQLCEYTSRSRPMNGPTCWRWQNGWRSRSGLPAAWNSVR
ncbi:MafI family immunity protein [Nocardioides sp. NPDC127503]|uniref:MafI family immunity protein n=1 Tax=Nocardioides sp. NPDC127503 TaxID=3154516 RepID=UPI00331D1499